MGKKTGSRIGWWIVPALVILGALGYYWYAKTGPETEKALVAREIAPDRKADISEGVRGAETRTGREPETRGENGDTSVPRPGVQQPALPEAAVKENSGPETYPVLKENNSLASEVAAQGPMEELFVKADSAPPAREKGPDRGKYCTLIQEQLSDFFHSLDTKEYFRRFNLESDAYPYFAHVIKSLAAQPPQPAGEGIQPATLITNIYFFSRALDRKDLRLIKTIVANERDTMEFNLETFYRWLMLGKECPDPGNVRPSFDVTYRYAGFFINTTGGRAYLFRRPLRLRVLLSYYCVLIVYQADRLGKNSYGLNIVPYIQTLKEELAHHPELEFQDRYLSTLNRIENYYLRKR